MRLLPEAFLAPSVNDLRPCKESLRPEAHSEGDLEQRFRKKCTASLSHNVRRKVVCAEEA